MGTIILNPMPSRISGNSLEDKFRRVGGNPGNLIFYESVKDQVNYTDIIDFTRGGTPCDNVIVPSSNFIRHVRNDPFFQRFIDWLNATDCKVTLCGLGAQGTKVFNTPKKLVKYAINPTQLRLFKMLSERAISIGVRGEFTAECLELMGIKNYRVIGCPSLFKYFDGVFPQIKRPTTENVQVGVTPGAPGSGKVIKLAERNDCIWVVQSQSEYPKYVNVCGGKILSPKWAVKNYGLDAINIREISNYFSKSNHVFWSIEDWNRFYSEQKVGFAFGTRFHGNMAALRNGIPALWVVHDSRTDELTKWLSLPRITYKEIEKVKSVDELFDYCDYSTIQSKYYLLCKNYIDFLEENGIEHRFNLKNL